MVNTLKTRDMSALKEKLKKQAGFTLAELLIVVAIMAILAAVAIPMYLNQMDAARRSVDMSTLSAATSMAASDYLLNNRTGTVTYTVWESTVATTGGNRNIMIGATASTGGTGTFTPDTIPAGAQIYTYQFTRWTGPFNIQIGPGGAIVASSLV